MTSTFVTVVIERRPVGPGPEWVRDQWIGLAIQVYKETRKFRNCHDIVSDTCYGPHEVVLTPTIHAFKALEASRPAAYDWYRSNGYTRIPMTEFMFPVDCLASDDGLKRAA